MAANEAKKFMEFVHKALGDIGGALTAVAGRHRRQARALQGDGRSRRPHPRRAGEADGHDRALRARVARRHRRRRATSPTTPATGRYTLPDEHAVALADEDSPACVLGGFQGMTAATRVAPKMVEAFRSGKGVGWHEHDPDLFAGIERFFRPGYNANLVDAWIPALDGVEAKLERGATRRRRRLRARRVDDHHGEGVPALDLRRLRLPPASIDARAERAATRASATACASRSRRRRAFPGTGYDLVACFDCLHDMGDPVGAARHVRESLAPDGTWLLVEPFANDHVEDNLNPIGRVFYSVSTLVCTPASLSQEVGLALGAQAGEARLRDVLRQAGFTPRPARHRDPVQPGPRGAPLGATHRRSIPWHRPRTPSPAVSTTTRSSRRRSGSPGPWTRSSMPAPSTRPGRWCPPPGWAPSALPFLDEEAQRTLNHCRAFSYVHLLGNYEEFIPFHLSALVQQEPTAAARSAGRCCASATRR